MTLRVAILIVSYDSASDIDRCLAALARSTYRKFTVTICENAGAAAYGRLRAAIPAGLEGGQPVSIHLADDNLGFAGGVNLCLTRAGGADAYWILNPDTEPAPEALENMVERLAVGDCRLVGHDLVLTDGLLASRGGGHWSGWSARSVSLDHGRPREPRPPAPTTEARMNYAVGASMLVLREFVEHVGLMREDYFLYCEEVEWCLRAREMGEHVGYAPEAVVVHAHGASTGGGGPIQQRSRVAVYLLERNRLLLTRDLFAPSLITAVPASLAHLLVKYGRARAWRQMGYALAGWWAGVRGERGRPAWFASPKLGVEGGLECSPA